MSDNMQLTGAMNLCGIKILDEKTKLLPIYFHSIGHYPEQKHVMRPDGFSHYQLAICLDGKGVFSSDGKEYDIKRGDVFFFSPQVSHEYYPIGNNWTIIWIVFGGQGVKNLLEYFSFHDIFVKTFNDEEELKKMVSLCNDLFCIYNYNESYSFELTVIMLKILNCIAPCADVNSRFEEDGGDCKNSFSPVIDFIKKHYNEMLSLNDLADVAQMSESHFCRSFKSEYGITPMAYLTRYRISVAKFLLATTEETVEIIADKTGFPNTSYFCSVFRKHEGISPNQYHKKYKNINDDAIVV